MHRSLTVSASRKLANQSGFLKKRLDFRTFGPTLLKNHARHALKHFTAHLLKAAQRNGIFINSSQCAHVRLPLTFFLVHFWMPGRFGLLRRHFHFISDIWIVTEGFLKRRWTNSSTKIFNETHSSITWRDVRFVLQPISTREMWQLLRKRHKVCQ